MKLTTEQRRAYVLEIGYRKKADVLAFETGVRPQTIAADRKALGMTKSDQRGARGYARYSLLYMFRNGKDTAEIAEITELSEAVVYNRMHIERERETTGKHLAAHFG